MSILSRNKFFAGRRLPESRKCGGLRAAVFLLWPAEGRNVCRGTKCRLRGDMPGGARAGRFVRLPFFVMACRRRKCCRRAKRWLRGDMPGGLFGRTVGAAPGRFGCRFVRSPILRRRLFGGRFVRLPIRSGSVFCRGGWPVLGLLVFRGDFPVGGCGNVSNA